MIGPAALSRSDDPTGSRVVLDISRTVARSKLPAPTGIDRVERAYIRHALTAGWGFVARPGRVAFGVPAATVDQLLKGRDAAGPPLPRDVWSRVAFKRPVRLRQAEGAVRRAGRPVDHAALPGTLIIVGHDLPAAETMNRRRQAGLRTLAMVHDLIPLDHPGYTRPGGGPRARRRLAAMAAVDHVICPSGHAADRFRHWCGVAEHAAPPVDVLPLGIDEPRPAPGGDVGQPGFVALGTIEPRKNIAFLLDLWSEAADLPSLHIIGRRGWEAPETLSRLDRAQAGGSAIVEHGPIDDAATAALLDAALALVFPSHSEGYGLPVAEALARGTPVIASDLPVLREHAGAVPTYCPVDDRAAWVAALRAHNDPDGAARTAHLARLDAWTRPSWPEHFRRLRKVLETMTVR